MYNNKAYFNNDDVKDLIWNGQMLFSWVSNDQAGVLDQARNAGEHMYAFRRIAERLLWNKVITEEDLNEIKESVYYYESFVEYGRIIHEEMNTLEDLRARYKKGEPIPLVSLMKW